MGLVISVFAFLLLFGLAGRYFTKVYQNKTNLNKMNELAAKKGGKCLSEKYIDSSTKLSWECSEFHSWKATPDTIKRGRWCPECSGSKQLTIEGVQELAIERGGKCLSDEYDNSSTKLRWECSERHVWKAALDSIKQGSWCPECSGSQNLTIEEMQEVAVERGGQCLSDEYINTTANLRWQCAEHHKWEAAPDSITQGSWCPECSRSKRLTIVGMQEIASERGGKCLSDKYINSSTKLTWECGEHHIWEAAPSDIKRKRWCPECAKIKRKEGP